MRPVSTAARHCGAFPEKPLRGDRRPGDLRGQLQPPVDQHTEAEAFVAEHEVAQVGVRGVRPPAGQVDRGVLGALQRGPHVRTHRLHIGGGVGAADEPPLHGLEGGPLGRVRRPAREQTVHQIGSGHADRVGLQTEQVRTEMAAEQLFDSRGELHGPGATAGALLGHTRTPGLGTRAGPVGSRPRASPRGRKPDLHPAVPGVRLQALLRAEPVDQPNELHGYLHIDGTGEFRISKGGVHKNRTGSPDPIAATVTSEALWC